MQQQTIKKTRRSARKTSATSAERSVYPSLGALEQKGEFAPREYRTISSELADMIKTAALRKMHAEAELKMANSELAKAAKLEKKISSSTVADLLPRGLLSLSMTRSMTGMLNVASAFSELAESACIPLASFGSQVAVALLAFARQIAGITGIVSTAAWLGLTLYVAIAQGGDILISPKLTTALLIATWATAVSGAVIVANIICMRRTSQFICDSELTAMKDSGIK